MKLDDLATLIATDVTVGNKAFVLPPVLITIIEFVVNELVQWFFQTYLTSATTTLPGNTPANVPSADDINRFLDYYNHMGVFRRIGLIWKIHREMVKHTSTGISSYKLANAMIYRCKSLTTEDVIELVEDIKNANK